MNNKLDKTPIIASVIIHIVLVVAIFSGYHDSYILTKFVVFGAHSKKETHAYYKGIPTQTHTTTKSSQPVPPKPKSFPKPKTVVSKEQKKHKKKTPPKKKPKSRRKQTPQKKQKKQLKKTAKKITQKQKHITTPQQQKRTASSSNKLLQFSLNKKHNKQLAHYQKLIQQEVVRVWQPPVGVPKGTECTVFFIIDLKGRVKHFELIKHSNMLLYDLSIIQSAQNFNFAKSLWGKQFTIEFRQ